MVASLWTAIWLAVAFPIQAPTPADDPSTIDVCARVPGAAVARLFGMKLEDERPVSIEGESSRCVYVLSSEKSPEGEGLVLWLYRPEDYAALLEFTEGIVERPQGFGDEAVLFVDPGDGRSKLRLLVRDELSLEATASTAENAKKLAKLALERFSH